MSALRPVPRHAVTVDALGVPIRIEVDDPALAASLERAWDWCLLDPGTAAAATVTVTDAVAPAPVEAVMEQLTQLVTLEAVGRQSGALLMLHACALADPRSGRAALLVGPSGMGKTTLAATLGSRWAYLSDETAGVMDGGEVVAYPKPLSVHSPSHPGKDQMSPAALGLLRGSAPATAAAVVLLRREPAAAETLVEEVPTVPAIAMLAEHTSYLARLDRPLHRLASLLHSVGGLKRVTYAEAGDLAPLLEHLLGERP
jgi:hypothetical protein